MVPKISLGCGLRLAWERGCRRLLCESDCRELVNNLADLEWVRGHSHRAILGEICDMLHWNWRIELSWVAREGNLVADLLTKRGLFLSTSGILVMDVPPIELQIILLKIPLVLFSLCFFFG